AVGVKLEDGYAAELIGVRIEELIVKDVVVLSENPFAVSLQVGLRRLAFDLIAQNFLLSVGVGDVNLIEDKHGPGKDGANHNHGESGAIDADAGGLHGGQFAGFLQQAEGDEHGEEYRDGRHQVKQRRAQVQQVLR